MPKVRTIYFTMGFSSIKFYLTPTEASYNVSPFSFQGEIVPCFVLLQRNKNCDPFLFQNFGLYLQISPVILILFEKHSSANTHCRFQIELGFV